MICDSRLQPRLDDVNIGLRCRNARLRLLLKGVKHVNPTSQFHRVNGAKSLTVEPRQNFYYARAAETLQRLGIRMLAPKLSLVQRKSEPCFDLGRKGRQVLFRAADPIDGFGIA